VKRFLISIVLFFIFALSLFGGEPYVRIPKDKQVENLNLHGGYCAWASLETVGNYLEIKKLSGLMKSRTKDPDYKVLINGSWLECKRNEGYDFSIQWKLDELGIKYRMSRQGFYDRNIINYGVKQKIPMVVAFKPAAFDGAHACILIGYDNENVVFIDPNYPGWNYHATRRWFDYYWDGFALVVEREQ